MQLFWWIFFFNFFECIFFPSYTNLFFFSFFSLNTNLKIKCDKNDWSWFLESSFTFFLLGTWECLSSLHAMFHRRSRDGETRAIVNRRKTSFWSTQKNYKHRISFITLGKLSNMISMHFFRLIFLTSRNL